MACALTMACHSKPPVEVVDVPLTGPAVTGPATASSSLCFVPAETIVNDPDLSSETHTMRMLGAVSHKGAAAVVTARDERLTVRVSDATGHLSVAQRVALPLGDTAADEVVLADMDGDGHPDAVSSDRKALWVARGSANGFLEPTAVAQLDPADTTLWLTAGVDADGDGKAELLYRKVDHSREPAVRTQELFGVKGGTLVHQQTVLADGDFGVLSIGDINGDGRADLAVGSSLPRRSIHFFLNNGNGFDAATVVETGPKGESHRGRTLIADFDGDGDADMATLGDGALILIRNDGGRFAPTQTFQLHGNRARVITGDYDGDGVADVMALMEGPPLPNAGGMIEVVVLRGTDTGLTLAARHTAPNHFVQELLSADINQDGRDDLTILGVQMTGDEPYLLHVLRAETQRCPRD
jgi:FG-GAP-like repeat